MRAAVFTKYGAPEGLELRDVPRPVPASGDVLVRIHATTVTAGDTELRALRLPLRLALPLRIYAGVVRPRRIPVLGMEFAGTVEDVGDEVTRFRAGDEVFGATGFRFGGYAEYGCFPESGAIVRKPEGVSFEDAATLPTGGLEALALVRRARIRSGERVLVYGGSGSIGSFAIQLARQEGAEITAVGGPDGLDVMQSTGAHRAIDYTTTDVTKEGSVYDVIIDAIGKSPFPAILARLAPDGRYLSANPRMRELMARAGMHRKGAQRILLGTIEPTTDDLDYLATLVANGTLRVVIDRRYPLEQVSEAHRYVDTGRKLGNVILTIR